MSVANPRTADGDAFRFRAGHPSLDLCSTLLWRRRTPVEQLRGPRDLARWLAEAELMPITGSVTHDQLVAARALREAIYALAQDRLRGRRLSPTAAAILNRAAAGPDRAPQLTADGELAWQAPRPVEAALAHVARDAIEILAGALRGRLGQCQAPDCAFLFLDTSPAGKRRWCAPDRCGNREHVREHRRRRREASLPSPG